MSPAQVDSDVQSFEAGTFSAVFSGSVNAVTVTATFGTAYGSAPQFGMAIAGGTTLFGCEVESVSATQMVFKVFYTPGGNAGAATVTGTWAVFGLPGT